MNSEFLSSFGSLSSTWQWFGPSQQKTSSISGIHLPASRTFPIASQDATHLLLPPPPSPSWLNIAPGRSPKLYTLVFPYSEDTPAIHILLGLKKRGFGEGRMNAFGGKPITNHDDIESPSDCALREFEEETGLRESAELEFTSNLKAHGRLLIHASNPSSTKDKFANELALLYIFSLRLTHEQLFAAKETEEMCPQVYALDNLPLHKMHPESSLLINLVFPAQEDHSLPSVVSSTCFDARIDYQGVEEDPDHDQGGKQGQASRGAPSHTGCRIARRWSVSLYDHSPA